MEKTYCIDLVQSVLDGLVTESIARNLGVHPCTVTRHLRLICNARPAQIRRMGRSGKTAEQIVEEGPLFAPKPSPVMQLPLLAASGEGWLNESAIVDLFEGILEILKAGKLLQLRKAMSDIRATIRKEVA